MHSAAVILLTLHLSVPVLCEFGGSDVTVIAEKNISTLLKHQGPPWYLIVFHAPWCGHCQRLEPEFKKAATVLKGKVLLAAIDCEENTNIAKQFRIESYPTMLYIVEDKVREYPSGRSTEEIVEWAEYALLSNSTRADAPSLSRTHLTSYLNRVALMGLMAAGLAWAGRKLIVM
eukprot:g29458.t1